MVNIVTSLNGVGLERDGRLIQELTGGKISNFLTKQRHPGRFKLTIFLEVIDYKYLRQSDVNVLIPNPEWFSPNWLGYKNRITAVLCKTKEAVGIFDDLDFKTHYIGFTSQDRYLPTEKKREFLHIAGQSKFKGTDQVIKAWQRNPHWPTLHITSSHKDFQAKGLNINYLYKRLPENEFQQIQNKFWFSVQPSAAEGFGHVINEQLSCGSIVITTDAAPMSEFKTPYKCAAEKVGPQLYGTKYEVLVDSLEEQVERVLNLTEDELKEQSEKSRRTFLINDKKFKDRFKEVISKWM